MNIRPLDGSRAQEAKQVWKTCFGDSDAFIDRYFKSFVQYERTLGCYEGGKLLADLFMLPFCGKLQERLYEADFLAGCATLPEARKQGLMRRLVREAMLDMKKRGRVVTYLHPFLHAFYRQFGYETVAYVRRESMKPRRTNGDGDMARIDTAFQDVPVRRMFDTYGKYIARFDNAFVRTEERFEGWLRLLFADGGCCATLAGTDTCAYALYYMEGDIAEVFELVCAEEAQRQHLLDAIPAETVNYFLPATNDMGGEEEFTMMRVLDPAAVLTGLVLKKDRFTVAVADPFLGEDYLFEIIAADGQKNRVEPFAGSPDIALSISEFAKAAAGAFPADDICADFFQRQTAVFFETY